MRKLLQVHMYESHIRTKVERDQTYAQALYCALCNHLWEHDATGATNSFSFREAGGVVADLRGPKHDEDYLDYYPSFGDDGQFKEGEITEEVEHDLSQIGWTHK